jgi:sodium/bile acid cotransporter 7
VSSREIAQRLRLDPFMLAILATVTFAAILPCRGAAASGLALLGKGMVALLFFLHGAHLSPAAAWQGLRQWRLQSLILGTTFVLFPLLGLAAGLLVPGVLPPQLYFGVLYLCLLPSTVQASITFTGIAGGNLPAALCAASASNLLGVVLTPLLAAVLLHVEGGMSGGGLSIVLQILLPFLAGQAARPWIGGRLGRWRRLTGLLDRSTILLIIYTAFSAGMVGGIWRQLEVGDLGTVLVLDLALLALVLTITAWTGRKLGLERPDEIALVVCGSTKSLVSGMPMLSALFPAATSGLIAVPMILFHQLQLIVCAALARRYARARLTRPSARIAPQI